MTARPALWRHLWSRSFGAVLAVWITLSAVATYTGFHEARKMLDAQLASVSQLWLAAAADRPTRDAPIPVPPPPAQLGSPGSLGSSGARSLSMDEKRQLATASISSRGMKRE